MPQPAAVPLHPGHDSIAPLQVAIIGAGRAGRSLAAQAVRAGHHVTLEDVLPSKLRLALADIDTAEAPGTLTLATTVEDAVRNADLVIDFVPDELESKLEIISMVDRMAPPKSILCIPTKALSLNDLASCTYRADRCIAVEITLSEVTLVTGPRTSASTAETASAFWESLGTATRLRPDLVTLP